MQPLVDISSIFVSLLKQTSSTKVMSTTTIWFSDNEKDTHAHRRHDPSSPGDDATTIRVIAPATLAEGYTFDVMVDGEPYTVHVPRGGVKEGQEFDVLYEPQQVHHSQYHSRGEDDETHDIDMENQTKIQGLGDAPIRTMDTDVSEGDDDDNEQTKFDSVTGAPFRRWRTGLCTCCDVVTQSTFWMGMCCTPVLIAQLITRLGLTWNGKKGSPEETSLSFNRIMFAMMVTLALWKLPVIGGFAMLLFYLLMVGRVGAAVRFQMRQRYRIKPSLPTRPCCWWCGPPPSAIDDGCCMVFCGCCSAIQMARHTHDDKEYPGHGCTTTGLGLDAPVIS